jgi:PAS domain S-box-containing protein
LLQDDRALRGGAIIPPESLISQVVRSGNPDSFVADTAELAVIRDLRGNFVSLSRAWATTLGFTPDELRGTPLLRLIHPADVWTTHDVMDGITFTQMVTGYANRYRCRDGSYRRLEWTARLFEGRVLGIGRDVTAA